MPSAPTTRQPGTDPGGELATALYQLETDAARLREMVDRHGRLWQPDRDQMNPDVQRLVTRAVDVVAAWARQAPP